MGTLKKYWWIILVGLVVFLFLNWKGESQRAMKVEKERAQYEQKYKVAETKIESIQKDKDQIFSEIQILKEENEKLKKQKPVVKEVVKYITIEKKEYVEKEEYSSLLSSFRLCEKTRDELFNKFTVLQSLDKQQREQYDISITERNNEISLIKFEYDRLLRKITRRWSLVIGPGIGFALDGQIRVSFQITLGYRII